MKLNLLIASILLIGLNGCARDAQVASYNLSADADQFKVNRRIVFYNSIQDKYILEMQGNCAIEVDQPSHQLEVTCKVGKDKYQKHYLGLSDNVTYTVEQLEYSDVSKYHYKIIFKPASILPLQNVSIE